MDKPLTQGQEKFILSSTNAHAEFWKQRMASQLEDDFESPTEVPRVVPAEKPRPTKKAKPAPKKATNPKAKRPTKATTETPGKTNTNATSKKVSPPKKTSVAKAKPGSKLKPQPIKTNSKSTKGTTKKTRTKLDVETDRKEVPTNARDQATNSTLNQNTSERIESTISDPSRLTAGFPSLSLAHLPPIIEDTDDEERDVFWRNTQTNTLLLMRGPPQSSDDQIIKPPALDLSFLDYDEEDEEDPLLLRDSEGDASGRGLGKRSFTHAFLHPSQQPQQEKKRDDEDSPDDATQLLPQHPQQRLAGATKAALALPTPKRLLGSSAAKRLHFSNPSWKLVHSGSGELRALADTRRVTSEVEGKDAVEGAAARGGLGGLFALLERAESVVDEIHRKEVSAAMPTVRVSVDSSNGAKRDEEVVVAASVSNSSSASASSCSPSTAELSTPNDTTQQIIDGIISLSLSLSLSLSIYYLYLAYSRSLSPSFKIGAWRICQIFHSTFLIQMRFQTAAAIAVMPHLHHFPLAPLPQHPLIPHTPLFLLHRMSRRHNHRNHPHL